MSSYEDYFYDCGRISSTMAFTKRIRISLIYFCLGLCYWEASSYVLLPNINKPKIFRPATLPEISPNDIQEAFDNSKKLTDERNTIESSPDTVMNRKFSADARLQTNSELMPQSMKIGQDEAVFEGASKYLVQKLGLTPDQAVFGLPDVSLNGNGQFVAAIQECEAMFAVKNCVDSKFRTFDGSCNNFQNPQWGKSFTCFARLIPPNYADGVSIPRRSVSGNDLPGPRVISTNFHNDIDQPSISYTHMLMQWGQFLDHDISLSPITRGANMSMIECCSNTGRPHPECFPINLPNNDLFFSQPNIAQKCMNFVRTSPCSSNCKLGPREQPNQLTAFIEGSQIYGPSQNISDSLRTFSDGQLTSQSRSRSGILLPPSANPNADQCSISTTNSDQICLRAGDPRVNQHPALSAMHTLWLRQHNNLARQFRDLFPTASDQQIFIETRRIIGAQLQMITYNEFLPLVLGKEYMEYFSLKVLDDLVYTEYDPNTEPTLTSEFSTAAYRFGHSTISNFFNLGNQFNPVGSYTLEDNFFNPFVLFDGQTDNILAGLTGQSAQSFDRNLVQAVTNHIYQRNSSLFGLDLAALNIQRGREHGIPSYTEYLNYFFDIDIKSFPDLQQVMSRDNWSRLSNLYQSPLDIDLFTGGTAETPVDGGIVGPTFASIIGLQFFHLKFGDRYYFEHGQQSGKFTKRQLASIKQTTLSGVMCGNTRNIRAISEFVMLPPGSGRSFYCSDYRGFDLTPWT